MSYERRTHVSAMSKLLNTARQSTAVNVARSIGVLTARLDGKSAMNWGTVALMWSLPTLEGGHE